MTSAASRPTGGRDSGAFSTLIASAGRFGTEPPVTPVRGHVGGGGGGGGGVGECVGEGEALPGAAVLLAVWLQPVITTAVTSVAPSHRNARPSILSIGGFLLFGNRFPGYRVRAPTTVAPRMPGNKSAVRFDALEGIHAPRREAGP